MPTVVADGIATRYEVTGAGPPLLMFSPGGFDATLDSWRALGRYRALGLLDALSALYTCITFDRRESGQSGGRVERIAWSDYVAQATGLLDALGVGRAHLLGGCVGCSAALALAVARPARVGGVVLFSPAGGAKYRLKQHARFARHLAHVEEHGLAAVVALAQASEATFTADPRVGPWNSVLRTDPAFAAAYAQTDPARYAVVVAGLARTMFDRDTVPGAEAEDLLQLDVPALVVPGEDESHAPSAARYLQECLPRAQYWDVPVAAQTPPAVPERLLEFLSGVPLS